MAEIVLKSEIGKYHFCGATCSFPSFGSVVQLWLPYEHDDALRWMVLLSIRSERDFSVQKLNFKIYCHDEDNNEFSDLENEEEIWVQ